MKYKIVIKERLNFIIFKLKVSHTQWRRKLNIKKNESSI